VTCPDSSSCSVIVEDKVVELLVKKPEVLGKYKMLLTNHFVISNKLMTWCPSVSKNIICIMYNYNCISSLNLAANSSW
jgi:hypothetical protein